MQPPHAAILGVEMARLRILASESLEEVHAAFLAAFADYSLPMRPGLEKWRRMTVRRGVDWAVSVGAYEGGRLVGLMATAVDDWLGRPTAYDVFTGVAPDHRGAGLSRAMFAHVRPLLRARGVERFLLEVLCDNEPAVHTYRRTGFDVVRELECLRAHRQAPKARADETVAVRELEGPDWSRLDTLHDWHPSWQNSTASVRRAGAERIVLGAFAHGQLVGYAVVFPEDADLAQLAVNPARRRRGVGSSLLAAAHERLASGAEMRVLNIPSDAHVDLAFYAAAGARPFARQYEMSMDLV